MFLLHTEVGVDLLLHGRDDKIIPGAALCAQNFRPFTGLSPLVLFLAPFLPLPPSWCVLLLLFLSLPFLSCGRSWGEEGSIRARAAAAAATAAAAAAAAAVGPVGPVGPGAVASPSSIA